jgi:hypothetical protein
VLVIEDPVSAVSHESMVVSRTITCFLTAVLILRIDI